MISTEKKLKTTQVFFFFFFNNQKDSQTCKDFFADSFPVDKKTHSFI